jgi:hypothetical protein
MHFSLWKSVCWYFLFSSVKLWYSENEVMHLFVFRSAVTSYTVAKTISNKYATIKLLQKRNLYYAIIVLKLTSKPRQTSSGDIDNYDNLDRSLLLLDQGVYTFAYKALK